MQLLSLSPFPPQPAPHHTCLCWDTVPGYFPPSVCSCFGCRSTVNFSTRARQHHWESRLALPTQDVETQNPSPVKWGRATSSPWPGALLLLQAHRNQYERFYWAGDASTALNHDRRDVTQKGATSSPCNREHADTIHLFFAIHYFSRLQCSI